MITRQQYVTAKHDTREARMAAHRAYHAQFVIESTIATVTSTIGGDRLLASTDEHLNDIPLNQWDALCGFQRRGMNIEWFGHGRLPISNRFKEAGTWCSPSDLVCIAKEAARQWIERQGSES